MDDFRRQLDKCGKGGIKCPCCRWRKRHKRKAAWWTRHVRRVVKQSVTRQLAGV